MIANDLAVLHFTPVHGCVERMISVHSKCSKSLYCWCVDGVVCAGVRGEGELCVYVLSSYTCGREPDLIELY